MSVKGEPSQKMKDRIILASSSDYKAAALSKLKIDFEQLDPDIDETIHDNEHPREACQRLALEKAKIVARKNPGALIIGADQIGICNQQILSKTGNKERAVAQILSMSGKLCHFFTAIAVAKNNGASGFETEIMIDTTKVQLRKLNEQEIQNYVELDNPISCAGSFKVESLGIVLFEKIETNDPSALIGLPLIGVTTLLKIFNIRLLENALT